MFSQLLGSRLLGNYFGFSSGSFSFVNLVPTNATNHTQPVVLHLTYYNPMKESLKSYFNKYINISDEEIEILYQSTEVVKLNKKEFLLKEGRICESKYFLIEGLVRFFEIDNNGNENINQFGIENWWITNLDSFVNALRLADYSKLPIVIVLFLGTILARAIAWRTILQEKISFPRSFWTLNEGYLFNNILPFRLGEVARAFLLNQTNRIPFWEVISTYPPVPFRSSIKPM